jgi:hypothetical protein
MMESTTAEMANAISRIKTATVAMCQPIKVYFIAEPPPLSKSD